LATSYFVWGLKRGKLNIIFCGLYKEIICMVLPTRIFMKIQMEGVTHRFLTGIACSRNTDVCGCVLCKSMKPLLGPGWRQEVVKRSTIAEHMHLYIYIYLFVPG
jgi:hypothetical protein